MNEALSRGSHRVKRMVTLFISSIVACALVLSGLYIPGFTQTAYAAQYEGTKTLYYTQGADGSWGLFTDSAFTQRFEGEGDTWDADAGTLTLTDFNYVVDPDSLDFASSALCILKDVAITLVGDNSYAIKGNSGHDTTAVKVGNPDNPFNASDIDVTITGGGTLSLSTERITSQSTGLRLTQDSSVTVDGTTLNITTGGSDTVHSYGIAGDTDSQFIVTNGSRVVVSAGTASQYSRSCGAYFVNNIHGATYTKSPLVVNGSRSSLITQGFTAGVFAPLAPELGTDPVIGVGVSRLVTNDIDALSEWEQYDSNSSTYYCLNIAIPDPPARTVQFAEAVSYVTTSLPRGVINTPYGESITVQGEPLNLFWSMLPNNTLPPGLSLNRTTGEISGTPTQTGTWTFNVSVSNWPLSRGLVKAFTIVIQETPSPTPPSPDNPSGGNTGTLAQTADTSILALGTLMLLVAGAALCFIFVRTCRQPSK